MPIDPQDGGPDDWFVPEADGYPNDWFVPESDGYPNDWFVPASATPAATQPAPDSRLGTANPTLTSRPAPPPDPLADYWSRVPASRVGAMAWHPPIFLNSPEQSPLGAPAPINAPWIDPSSGLLGGIANASSANPALVSLQPTGLASDKDDQPALPSIFPSLASLPWSAPPDTSATSGYAARQFPFLDGVPAGARPPGFTVPMLDSRAANQFALPFLQTVGPAASNSDGAAQQSILPDVLDRSALSNQSSDVAENSAGNPYSASQTDPRESRSITRVVRDATGRPLAIIHVQQEPPAAPLSESGTDATPDAVRSGAQYAQINNAVTGQPVIDRTTDMLLSALQRSIEEMGSGSGQLFGIKVHTDFAQRVKRLDLPGIGQDGVEQSFHLNALDFVRYGLDGSIRTDIALRDPKNPSQGPIAVYDLKTGNAVLTPSRVEEIRRALRQPDLPVIMLHYRTGNAVIPRRKTPEQ